jgi:hypothetical protein
MSGRLRAYLDAASTSLASLFAVAVLTLGSVAFAQPGAAPAAAPPAIGLVWAGPGPELNCLGEEGLARSVNEYIGHDAFASRSVDLLLRVNVERLPDRRWRAAVELADPSGRVLGARELTSSDELCSSLNEPLVLAVALMVDVEPEPSLPAPAPAPPPEEPPDVPDVKPVPQPRPTEPMRFFADATLAVESGLLPNPEPGLGLGFEFRPVPWLSARLGVLGFLPATVELPEHASARFALVAATLELCPGIGTDRSLRVALCVGLLYGALDVTTGGLTGGPDASWRPVLAASVGLRAAWPFAERWAVVAGVGGVIPHRPDRFGYELNQARQEIFRMSAVSVLASAGVSFRF